jgi:hypothetical protein
MILQRRRWFWPIAAAIRLVEIDSHKIVGTVPSGLDTKMFVGPPNGGLGASSQRSHDGRG